MADRNISKITLNDVTYNVKDAIARQGINEKANLDQVVRHDVTQSLNNTQKSKARSNIGAGTSNFDGDYNSLSNKPTIPDVSGKANLNQVVRYDVEQSLSDVQKAQARSNIGAGTLSEHQDISGKANVSDLTAHTGNKSNPHSVTKTQVGLGNVTNHAQVKRTEMGTANGVATLDASGKIPSSQLPSYVDDVIEGANTSAFPTTGESGKIYIDLSTNKTYRWSGSTYVVISETLALGETSSTAYAGNKGKANADAIDTMQTKLNGIDEGANNYTHPTYTAKTSGLYKVTVDATGHVSDATSITKDDIVALGIPAQDTNTTYSVATTSANGLMSSGDKSKLDNIAAYAEVNVQSDWNVTSTTSDAFIKNKPDLSVYAKKSEYLPLTGGTLSGNLTVGSSKIQSNGYIIGTWLQGTAANALSTKPPRICVQDSSGWIYSRTPAQILGDIGAASNKDYTANVTTTWSGTAALYTQDVAISGIVAADSPIIDLVPSTTNYAVQEQEWNKIVKAETYAGGIKFYAKEKTTTALPIKVKVVK